MQKLSSYVSEGIQKKVKMLYGLTLSIRTRLPVELASHCWVASIENRTLVIIIDSPELASLIRFQQREILKQLNQELGLTVKENLHQIKIKIGTVASDIKSPIKPMQLSRSSAKLIHKCAKDIQDTSLKEALKRLSLHKK